MWLKFSLGCLTLALIASVPVRASADSERVLRGTFGLGSGLSIGTGAQRSVLQHSPVFLDAGVRTWNDPAASEMAFGIGMRVEVDGRASVGAYVRAEYNHQFGTKLELSVFGGALVYVAPFTLAGPELGATLRLFLADRIAATSSVLIDGLILGSDLPAGVAMVQVNGVLGVEVAL